MKKAANVGLQHMLVIRCFFMYLVGVMVITGIAEGGIQSSTSSKDYTHTAFALPASDATLYVESSLIDNQDQGDGSAENPFACIQAAIEAAEESATIMVGPGVYRESLDYLGKSLVIRARDINEPIDSAYPVLLGSLTS